MGTAALGGLLKDKDKAVKLIVALGMAGMMLIMLSSIFGDSFGSGRAASKAEGLISADEYARQAEQRLERVVGQIEGVGALNVLITVENGFEQVYARSGKSASDSDTVYDSGRPSRVQHSQTSEHSYVLIDATGGRREALLITQIEPKIKGVVVVCQGADNMVVRERVISAVTTALGISSNRVCVTKKA